MPSSLPDSPSLEFLRKQAKDVHKAHRNGDPSCCNILRNLRQFAGQSDADILAAGLSLSEAQFALAMDYGFKDWTAMRDEVAAMAQSPMQDECLLDGAVSAYDDLRGRYPCTHCHISTQYVCMHASGWDIDFETLMTVSGAGLVFAYDPTTWQAKYAHTALPLDQRIADATGFGWDWTAFQNEHEAWSLITDAIDSGRAVRAHFWEDLVFAGYRARPETEQREVFALVTGPGKHGWWTWQDFLDWVNDYCRKFDECEVGRHTKRVDTRPAADVAAGVIRDAVTWATQPPRDVSADGYGFTGMKQFAADIADVDGKPKDYFHDSWHGNHAVIQQWTTRACTATYLEALVRSNALPAAETHLRAAAQEYVAAHSAWHEFNRHLGDTEFSESIGVLVPEDPWNAKDHRLAGAAAVEEACSHEQAAIKALGQALSMME